ncbi:class I SAM-dependent methyltransferase [Thermomonospora umbrina]|uniref:16S rRNA (Guanine1207-N2)-methyltransferase n=1 Tax=Thermomonospora umbrina TaxID=111806 RepID=A0A3D9SY59_9ACTN|nr:methyltransferase [Thermomonospora umbrina]REF00903.1 16S rRNA (guanine1207-N2)-methyltransferase [Thermomonospora umbrina]
MGEHYFAERPETGSRRRTVDLVLPDLHLRLDTDRGMFSPDRVDPGTRILLETVPPPPPEGNLLDLGCGYGPIALTMASRSPRAKVLGVDVNERALETAKGNARTAGLDNVRFLRAGEVDPELRFDALWSNPPIRIGKTALHDLLTTWLDRLSPGATAHLVVQKHLGSDSLHRWLERQGHATERIASRSSYRVLAVAARTTPAPRDPEPPRGRTGRSDDAPEETP